MHGGLIVPRWGAGERLRIIFMRCEGNMNVSCPHCGKQLKLSEKFRNSLLNLGPDQKARIKCTQCAKPFQIDSSMIDSAAAEDSPKKKMRVRSGQPVKPPEPPDVSWLKEGVFEEQEIVEEIPLALVLMPENSSREMVVKAVEALGYRAEVAQSAESAAEKLEFVNYSSVILHTDFEPGGLEGGAFYRIMRTMSMSRRRYSLFILIGKAFHTLYDLEALSYSANIVVNESDVPHFGTILRKAIPEYETLFGPLMEESRVIGK
jgi:CheY-like chemotaxis protein